MRLFVTGTDTDVGKTIITACLARAARGHGTVRAIKPVATGTPDGQLPADATHIGRAAGHAPECWASYETPVSPHRALLQEGKTLPSGLVERLRALRRADVDTLLVEGVGGFCVPLSVGPDLWLADLARALDAPVLIVAANRLGVINHTMLTVQAVRGAGLSVAGVVLNTFGDSDECSRKTNAEDLRLLLDVPLALAPTIAPDDDDAQHRVGDTLWRGIFDANRRDDQ